MSLVRDLERGNVKLFDGGFEAFEVAFHNYLQLKKKGKDFVLTTRFTA